MSDLIKLAPFGASIRSRQVGERLNEEMYRTIPALNGLAASVIQIAQKLSQDGRAALFTSPSQDVEMRSLRVEVALARREEAQNFEPDLAWLGKVEPPPKGSFQSKNLHEDEWLNPEPPGPAN
jgi:hypothetical protein